MLDLLTPAEFRGDPYGWLTNQSSHILAGCAGAWLGLWFGFPGWTVLLLAVSIMLVIEALHMIAGGSLADSLLDSGFVLGGALFVVVPNLPLFLALGALLAVTTCLRSLEDA